MIISSAGLKIIEKIEKSGFEAYFVGGCVRDVLMGKSPGDIDITTNAFPADIMNIFDKTYPTGINHGTITVAEAGITAEVTTYRSEKEYVDYRHPDGVEFVSDINEDLHRRDFTVNAIAYNPSRGFVDNFGGRADIENKTIRCVGDSNKRFSEDALRMVRAVRFAATLGFEIEENTLAAIRKNAPLVANISKERISTEFKKTVLGNFPQKAIIFEETGIIKYFCDSFEAVDFSLFDKLNDCPDILPLRFAVILKPALAKAFLKELRFSGKTIETTLNLIDGKGLETEADIKKYINKAGFENAKFLVHINSNRYKAVLEKIISEKHPVFIRDLEIDGTDLAKIGISGAKIGRTLLYLLEKVWKNPQINTKEKLIKIVKEDFSL